MQIEIQALGFSLTEALRNHALRRINFALSRNHERIQRIVMRLSDVNGPRGGTDMRCQLHILLRGMPDLVTDDVEADMYVAIDRATTKAGRSLGRRLKRHIPKRHGVPVDIEHVSESTEHI